MYGRKERNVLFNDALNTFYLRLYRVGHNIMVKDHSDRERGNPLPPHGYSFRLAARVLLYASSHRQDDTYHGLCYTSLGALAGTRNSSMVLCMEIYAMKSTNSLNVLSKSHGFISNPWSLFSEFYEIPDNLGIS